jgi:Leucine Rich repeat
MHSTAQPVAWPGAPLALAHLRLRVGPARAAEAAAHCGAFASLTCLDLAGNDMHHDGGAGLVAAIATAVARMPRLVRLILSYNNIGWQRPGDVPALGACLSRLTSACGTTACARTATVMRRRCGWLSGAISCLTYLELSYATLDWAGAGPPPEASGYSAFDGEPASAIKAKLSHLVGLRLAVNECRLGGTAEQRELE